MPSNQANTQKEGVATPFQQIPQGGNGEGKADPEILVPKDQPTPKKEDSLAASKLIPQSRYSSTLLSAHDSALSSKSAMATATNSSIFTKPENSDFSTMSDQAPDMNRWLGFNR